MIDHAARRNYWTVVLFSFSDPFERQLYVSRFQGGHQSMKVIGPGGSLFPMSLSKVPNGGIYGPQQDKNMET